MKEPTTKQPEITFSEDSGCNNLVCFDRDKYIFRKAQQKNISRFKYLYRYRENIITLINIIRHN